MPGLLQLVIFIVVVALVLGLLVMLVRRAPIDGVFKTWAEWLLYVLAVILILQRALPLAGVDL